MALFQGVISSSLPILLEIFYFTAKKENIDLILLALDYTKAFDSVNFDFIHKTFETFNFGETF